MKLIIATSNLHKLREYKAILKPLFPDFDLYSLNSLEPFDLPEETGATFEENAKIKALAAAKHFGELVLADDSGLVVPALNGEPGVKSARYTGENATDKDNRKALQEKLKGLPEKERVGYFECAICIANPKGEVKTVKGLCEGSLLVEERGGNGFGYDPLFVKYDYNKTLAELDEAVKNKISHRRKAVDKLIPVLETIVAESTEG